MEECVSVLLTDICELHLPKLMRVVFAVKTERKESAFLDVFLVIVRPLELFLMWPFLVLV